MNDKYTKQEDVCCSQESCDAIESCDCQGICTCEYFDNDDEDSECDSCCCDEDKE